MTTDFYEKDVKPSLIRGAIRVKASPIHRYGVFATQDIRKGLIFEECVILEFEGEETPAEACDYVFTSSEDEAARFLVLGFGSIYNHSEDPNARYFYDEPTGLMVYSAIKNIKKGEEIFISYGEGWFDSRHVEEDAEELESIIPDESEIHRFRPDPTMDTEPPEIPASSEGLKNVSSETEDPWDV